MTCKFFGVKALVKSKSGLALKCIFPDKTEQWVPISQIDDDSEVYRAGDEGTLITTEWWAIQAGVDSQDGEGS